MDDPDALSDKLKSLGVVTGKHQKQAQDSSRSEFDIARVVKGKDFETAFGPTFVVEIDYPFEEIQGNGAQLHGANLEMIGKWSGYPDISGRSLEEFLFLDTETSGLSGGTGTFVFLVGLGCWTKSGFHLVQLFLRDPDQEPGFLAGLAHYLSPFKTIVSFNGKSFDVPMLNTRHVLNGFSTPFSRLQHIDLLPLARRLWRNRLASRALKDLEVEILDLSRTDEEVPGWMIPELYYEYLRTKDARPLANVLYHNAQDILSLGLLLNVMADLLEKPLLVSPKQGLDLIAVARLYEEMNQWDYAVQLYDHSLAEGNLPLPFYLDTIKRYANLYRKRGHYDEALKLWIKAAEYRQPDACIEIAKYYEHRQRDPQSAIHWAERALTYLSNIASLPVRTYLQEEINHRIDRLRHKLQHSNVEK
jgi:uncharacterized protein YprB with RNaseH-like and TPR domain